MKIKYPVDGWPAAGMASLAPERPTMTTPRRSAHDPAHERKAMHKVGWDAWVKLLDENLEWLKKQPRTLEREHVMFILTDLVSTDRGRKYYESIPAPRLRP